MPAPVPGFTGFTPCGDGHPVVGTAGVQSGVGTDPLHPTARKESVLGIIPVDPADNVLHILLAGSARAVGLLADRDRRQAGVTTPRTQQGDLR
jgi:hypothetical protein